MTEETNPQVTDRSPHSKKFLMPAFAVGALFLIISLVIAVIPFGESKSRFIPWSLLSVGLVLLGVTFYRYVRRKDSRDGIVFYSHSQYLYFWPVWLVNFLFADLTILFPERVSVAFRGETVETLFCTIPHVGMIYVAILCTVIIFTSVNIRGVWALLLVALIVLTALAGVLLGFWSPILEKLGNLELIMNRDFYVSAGVLLFIPWFLVVFFFDMRRYIQYMPTQIKMIHEIGEGEIAFDTMGITMEKKRDNFFQHFLLGLGSGDLEVNTTGATREVIRIPNVLRVDHVLDRVHEIRERRGRAGM